MKRIFAMILVIGILALVMTGCGSKPTETPGTTTSAPTSTPTPAAVSPPGTDAGGHNGADNRARRYGSEYRIL